MYFVYCDNKPLYDLRDESLVLEAPTVSLSQNDAGSFEFIIMPKHPHYDDIHELESVIRVLDRDEEIFCGRVVEVKRDRLNKKQVFCESELAYFNDSIQRPAEYQGVTVQSYLNTLISIHNNQVSGSGIDKTFELGVVTVVDPNNYVYKFTNWESTLEVIKKDLLETYGGYLRIRKQNGHRYLDYLKDYPNTNNQVIEFGENLLDFTEDMIASDIATAIIPLGAVIQPVEPEPEPEPEESDDESEEETEEVEETETVTEESEQLPFDNRVTIESVNGGIDFVYSAEAVSKYGWIFKTVIWDDVNLPENLKRKGLEYLSDIQFSQIQLEVNAVDLHMMDVDIERIKILDRIRILSTPNGLDRFFPVTEMKIQLDKPSNNTVTLGSNVSTSSSITSQSQSQNEEILKKIKDIPKESDILAEAKRTASELIKSATNGHVVLAEDASELLIMDTDDPETANNVWRWNLNGLGYSSTGYNGQYNTAITMDGHIVASFLGANSIVAELIDSRYTNTINETIARNLTTAEQYTDTSLASYYTKSEVSTAISQTRDAVLLQASENTQAVVNNALKAYSTSAQIKVTTDAITSEVNKKVGYTEIISKINQTAETIKIQASKIALEGIITTNGNVKIDASGNITVKNGSFSGAVTATSFRANGSDADSYCTIGDQLTMVHKGTHVDQRFILLQEQFDTNVWNYVQLWGDHITFSQTSNGSCDFYYMGGGDLQFTGTLMCEKAIYTDGAIHVVEGKGLYDDEHGYIARFNDGSNHNNMCMLGNSNKHTSIYATGNVWKNGSSTTHFSTTSSDRRLKEHIGDLSDYEDFFTRVKPVAFKYHDGLYNFPEHPPEIHWGFYAQDVVEAFDDSDLDWTEEDLIVVDDGEYPKEELKYVSRGHKMMMNYQNMTALNTHMIQKLLQRIDELEERIGELNG